MARTALAALVLSAKRSVWRMNDHADESDKAFKAVRDSVVAAADETCQYCGHKSTKYQEVHHIDDNHKNNAPKNLVCSCPLCHQVFHAGLAGLREGAEVIYAPELTQEEINQLSLILWMIAETKASAFPDAAESVVFARLAGRAKTIEGQLENRRGAVLVRLRKALEGTSFPPELVNDIRLTHLGPAMFASVLMKLEDDVYDRRKELLGGLRMLPKSTRFSERIKHWNAEQTAVLPIPTWFRILSEGAMVELITQCNEKLSDSSDAAQQV